MSPETQKPIGKNTLRVLGILEKVDDAISRITYPIWKRVLASRGVEMYRVDSLGEHQALMRRIAPLIQDAAEIRIAEGDLSEGLLSERGWRSDARIRVSKTPVGDAPEEYRRLWRGLEMDAFRLPASEDNVERSLVSGEQIPPRQVDLYAVRLEEALQVLEQKSPEAAKWFREHATREINSLTFAANEVKVIKRRYGNRL